jgi:hypothetical protein
MMSLKTLETALTKRNNKIKNINEEAKGKINNVTVHTHVTSLHRLYRVFSKLRRSF